MPDKERPEERLAAKLGCTLNDTSLLREALTHSSATAARGVESGSYERLEFLGDRVLGLIVADMLLYAFPDEAEGALARRHAYLVSRDALARVARTLDLGGYLLVSRGEAEGGGRENPALLADVCEALIGALYTDGGLGAARAFVEPHWRALLKEDCAPPQDAKTALQEWAQGQGLPLPRYQEVAREGPPHEPRFTVSVEIRGEPPEHGAGRSKRFAEQEAARRLLARVTRGQQA